MRSGIAQWLERRTRDWKVAGSNPCWNGGRVFLSRVNFLCWLLFQYPFHPRVTTVAHKRSRSFCQKCRWQVTAKHAYTHVCGFEWSDTVTWCMVEWCTQNPRRNGSIWRGTSHATGTERYQWILIILAIKGYSHSFRIACDMCALSLLESRE